MNTRESLPGGGPPKNQRNSSNFQKFDILYLIQNAILDTGETLPRGSPPKNQCNFSNFEILIFYTYFKIQFWILESLYLVEALPKNQSRL